MSPTILSYILYSLIMTLIIGWLGQQFYRRGRVFIVDLFKGDIPKADSVNQLLRLGYYLINIGYVFLQLKYQRLIKSNDELLEVLSCRIGLLQVILAVLHYTNMIVLYIVSRNNKNKSLI